MRSFGRHALVAAVLALTFMATCFYSVADLVDGGADGGTDSGADASASDAPFCSKVDATLCEDFDQPLRVNDGAPSSGWYQNGSGSVGLDDASFVSPPYSLLVDDPGFDGSFDHTALGWDFGYVTLNQVDVTFSVRILSQTSNNTDDGSILRLVFWYDRCAPAGSDVWLILQPTYGYVLQADHYLMDGGTCNSTCNQCTFAD